MQPLRQAGPRPSSPSSVNTTRSSFESRTKSPLSVSFSADYVPDDASNVSPTNSLSSYNGKPDFAPTRLPPKSHWQQKAPEAPANARYGVGGAGRQQNQGRKEKEQVPSIHVMPLMKPPKRAGFPQPRPPGEGFRRLPNEVLLIVLAELRKAHLGPGGRSCSTCWMREALNVGLSCKKWWHAARIALYEDIQLIGIDSLVHTKKRYKMKHGTRLKLLRRTLRAQPDYAQHVKSLKVPGMPDTAKTKQEQDEYADLVASVIMACPNLEKLPGFYPVYNHEFSRFVHALSSRTKLIERVWIINPSRFQRQHRYNVSEDFNQVSQVVSLPGPLLPQQSVDFLTYHSNWSSLKTLFLHCNLGGTVDSLLFEDVFHSLPRLEDLYISSFPANSFNDSTLVSLPALKSLRLDRLPGVTSEGLSAFISAKQRHSLRSLSLIQIPLLSLPVLARMFSYFSFLTNFTISQSPSPALPIGETIFLHPYLASASLQKLHWEFTNADTDTATGILSKSMAFGGFPSLRTVRAPTDFEGLLQTFCRPRDRIELASDRYRNLGNLVHSGLPHSQSAVSLPSPTKSTFSLGDGVYGSGSSLILKSPSRSTFSQPGDSLSHQFDDLGYKGISLATSRRMAQHRIEASTTQPQFHIIVWDESGQFLERFEVGAFIGQVNSKVFYSLQPDVDGMDEAVVQFEGVGGLLDGGEETSTKEGCTGSWYLDYDARKSNKAPNKKKEEWWHTERGRWKEVPLEKFF